MRELKKMKKCVEKGNNSRSDGGKTRRTGDLGRFVELSIGALRM